MAMQTLKSRPNRTRLPGPSLPPATDAPVDDGLCTLPADGPELAIHPLAELFPAMSDAAFARFREDVRAAGRILEPITLHEGRILDGRHRYRAGRELGLPVPYRDWSGAGTPEEHVVRLNGHRRHLNPSQLAMVAALFIERERTDGKSGRRQPGGSGGKFATVASGKARDRYSQLFPASPRSIQDALTVRTRGIPELSEAVLRGERRLSTAVKIAALPPGRQKAALEAGEPPRGGTARPERKPGESPTRKQRSRPARSAAAKHRARPAEEPDTARQADASASRTTARDHDDHDPDRSGQASGHGAHEARAAGGSPARPGVAWPGLDDPDDRANLDRIRRHLQDGLAAIADSVRSVGEDAFRGNRCWRALTRYRDQLAALLGAGSARVWQPCRRCEGVGVGTDGAMCASCAATGFVVIDQS